MSRARAEDVAAASAAHLFDVLPELLKLPEREKFERLKDAFATCILAYVEPLANPPEPSRN